MDKGSEGFLHYNEIAKNQLHTGISELRDILPQSLIKSPLFFTHDFEKSAEKYHKGQFSTI